MSESPHERFSRSFRDVCDKDQALLLLTVAHGLTIGARESYPPASAELAEEERCAILRNINELQHRILSHSVALLTSDERRYPIDVLLGMLQPDVQSNDIVAKGLSWSLARSCARGRDSLAADPSGQDQ